MQKRLLTISIFLAILAVAFFLGPLRFPISLFYPIRGIDVSHHQKRIDWPRVSRENVQFAWIKASEGGSFRDSLFKVNWVESKKAGIPRGAYHFLTFCRPGDVQARNFIEAVGQFDSTDLIPAIDIEYDGNCSRRVSQKEMEILIADFTTELRTVSKNPPIIYMTREIYRDYFVHKTFKNKLWARAIITSPSRSFKSDWAIWQYNHRGRVSGIKGPVDFNVIQEKTLNSFYNRY